MIGLGRFEGDDAPQNEQSFFLAALLLQLFESILVGANGELFVGLLEQLPKAHLLLPGRAGVAR